jgi:hypothetical protein
MLGEKFSLLLGTLMSRVVEDKLPTVVSTRATFPDRRHSVAFAAEQVEPVIFPQGSSQTTPLWNDTRIRA